MLENIDANIIFQMANDEFFLKINPKDEFPVEIKQKAAQRSPPALSCLCKICGAPAPNHFHFGGEFFSFSKAHICQVFRSMLLLLPSLFPSKHSQEKAAWMAQVRDNCTDFI